MTEDGHGIAYKWKVLASVVFGIFMVILDTTVVNVAFPTLRTEFHAPISEAQWIVSIYVLGLGVGTPPAGFLADRFGIKRTYLVGLSLFGTGSLVAGVAPHLVILIGARALQAIGGGIAVPLGSAMLYQAFPPNELGLALGLFGIALLVAPAIGPILGGILIDAGLWRWIFFINVPIAIVGVSLASRLLQERRGAGEIRLDVPGFILSTIGFAAVLYAASIASTHGWTSTDVLVAFGIGITALASFAWFELTRASQPLLELRLFRIPYFLTASLIGYVTVLALFGAEFLMPLYLQTLRGRDALQTGLILLPLAVTAAVTTPVAGRIFDGIGPRPLVVFGFLVLSLNTWQLSRLETTTAIPWIIILLALRGLALGVTVQTTFATALGSVPRDIVARGSSLINATRYVVQAVGVAVLATVLASTPPPAARPGQPAPAGAAVQYGTVGAPSTTHIGTVTMRGFEAAYRLTFYLALAAIPIALFLPGWPREWRGRAGMSADKAL